MTLRVAVGPVGSIPVTSHLARRFLLPFCPSHTFFWFEEIDDVSGADLLSNAMLEFFDWGQ